MLEQIELLYNLPRGDLNHKIKDIEARRRFRELPFLFVLDGVDELGHASFDPANPTHTCAFPIGKLYNIDVWPNSVFVIASRTDFFKDDDEMLRLCGPRNRIGRELLNTDKGMVLQLHLLSFDQEQKSQYINNFARVYADMHTGWDAARYRTALKQHKQLEDMLTEPLMRYLVLNVLPMLEDTAKTSATGNVNLRLNPDTLDVEIDPLYVFPPRCARQRCMHCSPIAGWSERQSDMGCGTSWVAR